MPSRRLALLFLIQPRLVAEAVPTNSQSEVELISCSDSELLSRFCEAGDEAGFRAIVERHAAMVSSVCLSVLRNTTDAEDAFQATFFVLARKARTVRERKSLAAWLHRVALRSALAARRKRSSRPATELPPEDILPESALRRISSKAVVSALHEELDRLPEKYRTTLIACYLEGSSRKEAAEKLGITEAAVKTRLERARRMLRRKLSVLGFAAFSTVGLCQLAMVSGANAMATAKVTSTVCIAMQVKVAWSKTLAVAAGNQASLNLAQGVLKTMMIATALKTTATAAFGLLAGVFAMTAVTLADDPPNPAVVEAEVRSAETTLVLQDRSAVDVVGERINSVATAADGTIQEQTVRGRVVDTLTGRVVDTVTGTIQEPEVRGRIIDRLTGRVVDTITGTIQGQAVQGRVVDSFTPITGTIQGQTVQGRVVDSSTPITATIQGQTVHGKVVDSQGRIQDTIQELSAKWASGRVVELTAPIDSSQSVVDLLGQNSQWRPMQALITQDKDGYHVVQWRMLLTPDDESSHTGDIIGNRATWSRLLPGTEEIMDQNERLQDRVEELEATLKLHRRVAALEAENARLKEQIRQLKDDDED